MNDLPRDNREPATWAARPVGGDPLRLLLNLPEAARALGISPRAFHDLAKSGQIRRILIGRSVRYDLRDLMAFIDAKKGAAE